MLRAVACTPQSGTLSYDERNRLATTVLVSGVKPNQITTTNSYLFNARGERVQTSQNGLGPVLFKPFLYDEAGKLLATGTSKSADEVIYLDALPVARVQAGSILPIETDHLGTPRVIQDATGSSTTWTWNLLSNTATGSNAFGEQAASGSDFNLRFPGQYADGNGLHYNYFRDYEPGTGRYVESDPVWQDEPSRQASTYIYSNSNPLYWVDSNGLWPSKPDAPSDQNGWDKLCAPLGIPTLPPKCLDQEECTRKAQTNVLKCTRKYGMWSLTLRYTCIMCWKQFGTHCAGSGGCGSC